MKIYQTSSCFLLVFFLLLMPYNAAASEINSSAELAKADIGLLDTGPEDFQTSETAGVAVHIEGRLYDNEYAMISVTIKNNGEKSSEGHVTVSFPNNEEILSMDGSGDRVEFYPRGSKIEGKDGEKIGSSEYPFVDLVKSEWDTGKNETLTLKVMPNKDSSEVVFLVRAALKNDATGSYERYPSISSDMDQQGWYVYKNLIGVTGYPDLIIEDISWEPVEPLEHENVTFKLTLKNVGLASSGNSSVKFYLDGNEIYLSPVSGLEAGSTASFIFNWVPTSSGNMDLKVVIDAGDQFFEFDKENNERVEIFKVRSSMTSSSSSSSSSSGSSSSSSGSGGTGGSPEPASNVEVKELAQQFISNGNHAKFVFAKNVTSIAYIGFDPKRTAGKTTTIVETLKGKSTLVTELPSGKVYENMNIWVGNEGTASPENIENAVIGFKVKKTWINSNGVDSASVRLWKFDNGEWVELSTSQTGEDDDCIYYEADTPGFASFIITALSPEEGASGSMAQALGNSVDERDSRANSETSGEGESYVTGSAAREKNSEIFGSTKKVLLPVVMLAAAILAGYMILKKRR